MMSTHVYFYTIFFLKPWFSEINGWWESGREWRDTGADPGVLQVCVCVCVCVQRGHKLLCIICDGTWLVAVFPVSGLHQDRIYLASNKRRILRRDNSAASTVRV